ncbi:unnamed protein product [Parnassius apollo]|uniref:(apollo) hypothetical protein n=1 Tax=Parnassius apollo TaxID=110799 RepID=A0A8S3X7D3_PARAO|nr:unnamed protein product [Parnassius apollo]
MAFAGTNVSLSQPDITQKLTERIDDLKQRIAAWGKRIRRYTERSTRFNQNRLFQRDQKRLYESLERPMVSGTGPAPNQADTVAFWRGLWSEPVNHSEGPWTEVVASQCAGITPMDPVIITPDDVAEAVRRAPNWKSPGLDGLRHYWLKGFMSNRNLSVEAVDYSKCLGTKGTKTTKSPHITQDNEKLLSKDEFVKLVGKNKVDCIEKGELTSEESFELIKRIWHFFGTPSNLQNTVSQQQSLEIINKDDDFSHLDIENMPIFINDWQIILLNPKNQS